MKRHAVLYVLIPSIIFSSVGCAKKPAENDNVLARVSNKKITLGDFNRQLDKLPSNYRTIIEKNKKLFLDEMVIQAMLYEEALRQGIDQDKEIKEILVEARKKIMVAKLIKNEVEDKARVPEAEARQFYESNKEEFMSPPMWRASHILVSSEQEAGDIGAQLKAGGNFEEIAKAKSTDATASRGGDVGYFREGQLIPEFESAALKLKPGDTSDIVKTQFGYHIIKLSGRKDPSVEPYEKVKPRIDEELKKKKRVELLEKLIRNLKTKYNVEIQDGALKMLNIQNINDKEVPKAEGRVK